MELTDASAGAANFDLAIIAATISILIGGILYGIGLGFSIRRMRLLGAEEIGQGIVSAALVGGLLAFALVLDTTVSSLVPQDSLPYCPGVDSPSSSPHLFCQCNLHALSISFSNLSSQLSRSADIAGFAASLKVNAGVVSAQPFFALESASKSLSASSQDAAGNAALAELQLGILEAIRSSAMMVLLPIGLLLRSFFATRKLGAAAMAIAVSAYAVYPLIFLYTFSISSALDALSEASEAAAEFNSDFASIPLMDLDETGAVRQAIMEMSESDFGGRVQPLFPLAYRANSLSAADLAIYPILSILVSAVAALEIYGILSGPIFLPYFERI